MVPIGASPSGLTTSLTESRQTMSSTFDLQVPMAIWASSNISSATPLSIGQGASSGSGDELGTMATSVDDPDFGALDDTLDPIDGRLISSQLPDVINRNPYAMSIEDLTSVAVATAQSDAMSSGKCYLPPVDEGYALLMEYLHDFNSKIPLIAPQHIYQHMRNCYSSTGASPAFRLSWMLTYPILGIAHRLRAMSLFDGPDDMAQADWYLDQALIKLPHLLMQEPSLEMVQALLAVSVLLQTSARSRRAALFVSNAMHMLQDLGYHNGQTLNPDPLRGKEKQYVFWLAFIMNTDMSLVAMRQSAQSLAETGVPLLSAGDVNWWAETQAVPNAAQGSVNVFALSADLAVIQAEALEGLFSVQSRHLPEEVLTSTYMNVINKLHAWRRKSAVFDGSVEELYKVVYRSDVVHLIVLEGAYFRTLYQIHTASALGGLGGQADVFTDDALRAMASLETVSCFKDAKRLLKLSALIPGGNISTTWSADTIADGLILRADIMLCHDSLDRLEHALQYGGDEGVAAAASVCRELLQQARDLGSGKVSAIGM
ncbi:hypothetical protein LTR53_017242 [Teratosphaeriaceae sp. CCFEE 6253]|nr:hypothetical protein LTR53_017242 [Teratosphaeriaceae sp. CCFEE 6253]